MAGGGHLQVLGAMHVPVLRQGAVQIGNAQLVVLAAEVQPAVHLEQAFPSAWTGHWQVVLGFAHMPPRAHAGHW